eukprot:scaffold3159_cov191-Alexandrium_tamarense.AAC.8
MIVAAVTNNTMVSAERDGGGVIVSKASRTYFQSKLRTVESSNDNGEGGIDGKAKVKGRLCNSQ